MRALSSTDCLEIWERGARRHPVDRSLLALSVAFPEASYENLADWPLGRRNQALAELRCACFGTQLEGWVACPTCSEKMEFKMDARALAAPATPPRPDGEAAVVFRGRSFRLPTSRDLASAARESDPRRAAIRLMEACTLDSSSRPELAWSDQDLEEAGERMALADPMAETRLTLDCAACGNRWEETLDITDFLWTEVQSRARRLLMEVHTLAAAYGWSEREILALSEIRRMSYLEMVRE